MAYTIGFVAVTFSLFYLCIATESLKTVNTDEELCLDECTMSYALDNYVNGSDVNAYLRGCRFYKLHEVIRRGDRYGSSNEEGEEKTNVGSNNKEEKANVGSNNEEEKANVGSNNEEEKANVGSNNEEEKTNVGSNNEEGDRKPNVDDGLFGLGLLVADESKSVKENNEDELITDSNSPVTKELCYNSCVESYSEVSPGTNSCRDGCNDQANVEVKEKTKDSPDDELHGLIPLMQIHEIKSTVKGMFRIIKSSILTFFLRDDNSILEVESEPQMIIELLPNYEDPTKPVDGNEHGRMGLTQDEHSRVLPDGGDNGPSSKSMINRPQTVPDSILLISFVAFIVFTTYILFTICHSPILQQGASKKGFMMDGSMSTNKNSSIHLPIKLVRPEDLTKLSLMEEEDLQAPALPIKVHIPYTKV